MNEVTTSTSGVEGSVRLDKNRTAAKVGFAAWLLRVNADRWRRRAQFYECHRDYFPRLASGRFIDRCRELEATYRGLAQVLFNVPPQAQLVPVRAVVSRIR
jgi:hypothetical protein